MNLKATLNDVIGHLDGLVTAADGIENKHLRDLLADGRGRLKDAAGHPDAERVGKKEEEPVKEYPPVFDTKPTPGPMEPSPATPAPFMPHAEGAQPDDGVKHPGDPEFQPENMNSGFTKPDDVDLNPDGTLQHAPNAFGRSDVRKE